MGHSLLPSAETRAVDEDPADKGYVCYLCGGRNSRLLHHWPVGDRWNPATIPLTVWRCECGLVFLYPSPTPEQMPGRGDWWSRKRKKFRRRRLLKLLRTAITFSCFGTPRFRLVKYTRKAIPSGRLLDVGCGDGRLLALAAPYYDCTGLEPSPIGAARARDKGFRVLETTLEETRIEPHSFDVITMDSVIEHVRHPLSVLKRANRILKPGGIIALKTNKFEGPAYRLHGRGWCGFRHGYHTFLFTGATLGLTLERAGFEVLKRPRRDRILDDILILWGRKFREVEPDSEPADPPVYASDTLNRSLAACD